MRSHRSTTRKVESHLGLVSCDMGGDDLNRIKDFSIEVLEHIISKDIQQSPVLYVVSPTVVSVNHSPKILNGKITEIIHKF